MLSDRSLREDTFKNLCRIVSRSMFNGEVEESKISVLVDF